MAKFKGTLAVSGISGRAGGLVFYQRRDSEGVIYARSMANSLKQPRTIRQVSTRAYLQGAAAVWRALSETERAAWAAEARTGQTGYHAYCAHTLREGREGHLPQREKGATHAGRPPAPTALTATSPAHCLVFTWYDAPGAFTTGIYLGETPDFAPTKDALVSCVPAKPGTLRQATVIVCPGRYYAVARSGAADGGVGAAGAMVGAVDVV